MRILSLLEAVEICCGRTMPLVFVRINIVQIVLCIQKNLGGIISQCKGRVFPAYAKRLTLSNFCFIIYLVIQSI